MKSNILAVGLAILITASSAGAIGLRVGVGAEIIPLTYSDLKDYNTGSGYGFRADIVWGRFSATTVESGYRKWEHDTPLGTARKEFHRIGLLQRFYPILLRDRGVSPYFGAGITATNRDSFSLSIPDADYTGVTLLAGCEIPLKSGRLRADPYVRWELNFDSDYYYSYISIGGNLVWKLF